MTRSPYSCFSKQSVACEIELCFKLHIVHRFLFEKVMNLIHPEVTDQAQYGVIALFPTLLHLFSHCLRIV